MAKMPSSLSTTMSLLHVLLLFFSAATTARAQVPVNETFKFVNNGEFGPYIVEYDGNYRILSVFSAPFQLAFYNTTAGAFTLALRMGLSRSESLRRWVWEANRGNPVSENATFSLSRDGNLVLAHADGRIAWQTNTTNKGVVGFKLLSTGNMVLYNKAGKFVWQSFDHPTDTLLVGQSLRLGDKLVSRLSAAENKDGPYSLVLEPKGFSLYYKGKSRYFSLAERFGPVQGTLQNVTLTASPETDEAYSYNVALELSTGGSYFVGRPKYNATLSLLRLGIDGNVKVYTYYDKVDSQAWEVVFSIFDDNEFWENECRLPERCGALGVCEDNQCVACPSEKGLLGWSKSCAAKKVTSCKPSDFHYYKVEGVDHFLSNYNRGSAVSESDCGKKCTSDCKCLGYFYNRDSSRCWIAYDLMTLAKVANSTHVGYIKTPNK